MKTNVTFSIGNVALIDKVNEKYQLFNRLFDNLGGKAKNIKNSAKLFSYNRLGDCVSINQLASYAGLVPSTHQSSTTQYVEESQNKAING